MHIDNIGNFLFDYSTHKRFSKCSSESIPQCKSSMLDTFLLLAIPIAICKRGLQNCKRLSDSFSRLWIPEMTLKDMYESSSPYLNWFELSLSNSPFLKSDTKVF